MKPKESEYDTFYSDNLPEEKRSFYLLGIAWGLTVLPFMGFAIGLGTVFQEQVSLQSVK